MKGKLFNSKDGEALKLVEGKEISLDILCI